MPLGLESFLNSKARKSGWFQRERDFTCTLSRFNLSLFPTAKKDAFDLLIYLNVQVLCYFITLIVCIMPLLIVVAGGVIFLGFREMSKMSGVNFLKFGTNFNSRINLKTQHITQYKND